jgi:hypothetical protein
VPSHLIYRVTLLLMLTAAGGIARAEDPPADAAPAVLAFALVDGSGHLLVGGTLTPRSGWLSNYSYSIDPLTLMPPPPGADLTATAADIPPDTLYHGVDSSVLLYSPSGYRGGQQLQSPEHPSQAIFTAKFSDGVELFVRVSVQLDNPRGEATWQGETVLLEPMTPLGFALRQMQGTPDGPKEVVRQHWPGFVWVAAADVRSLIASTTGVGQQEAFDTALGATRQLLEEYWAAHGAYPMRLEDLWQGDNAVVSFGPGNPFAWPDPLLVSNGDARAAISYERTETPATATHAAIQSFKLDATVQAPGAP